jgi:hypothetical protein
VAAWALLVILPMLFVAGLAAAMDAKGVPGWQRLRQRLAAERQRQEGLERAQRLKEALAEYTEQAEPRLRELAPEAVRKPELEAGVLVMLSKRSPQRAAAVRARVATLKDAADEVVRLTAGGPSGFQWFDRRRERVRAFAAARAHSLGLLLAMLDAPGPPSAEAWGAWQSSRREADRLWGELAAK